MRNVKGNKRWWKQLIAILIVAVMLFTTPHIVGLASSLGSDEAATTQSADQTGIAVQSEEEEASEAASTEAAQEEAQTRSSAESEKTAEARTESEKPSENTTEALENAKPSETAEPEKTEEEEKIAGSEEKVAEETEEEKKEENRTSEQESEENTTDQNEEESKLEKSFRYENDDVKISVKELEAGSVADGIELQVTPIEKDNKVTQKQYTEVRKQLLEKAQNEAYDIAGFLAYDIAFVDENGDKVEPDGKVQVSMEYKKRTMPEELKNSESAANTNVTVMHLEEDTTGKVKEVVDMSESEQLKDITTTNKKVVKTVDFETESFSVFTITWTLDVSINITVNLVDDKGNVIELKDEDAALNALNISDRDFDFSSGITESLNSQYYKLTDIKKQKYKFDKAVVTDAKTAYNGNNGTQISLLQYYQGKIYYYTSNNRDRQLLANKKLYFTYTELLSEVETVDSKSKGISIKMINLEGSANKYLKNGDKQINLGGNYGSGNIKQNLVKKRLDADGYPVASNGAGSLSALFKGSTETNQLFIKSIYDKTGYYEYSSFENYAYLDTSVEQLVKNFKVYKQIGTPSDGSQYYYKRGNFMPYNAISDENFSKNTNQYDEDGAELSDTAPRKGEKLYITNGADYYFGMEVSANFVQQKNGKVTNNGTKEPMIYEFNGDDDMWVYIDGTLVLDIGGIHDAHSGKINFATGVVSWKDCVTGETPEEYTTTIKDMFKNSGYFPDGTKWNNSKVDDYFTGNTFKDYSTHTMRMFYFERGAGASNLHMKFNLPVIPDGSVEVKKELSNTDKEKYANVQFKFKLYAQKANSDGVTFSDEYEALKSAKMEEGTPVTFDSDGAFYLKPGQKAIFSGLKEHQKYYVEEIGVKSDEYDDIKINDVSYTEYQETTDSSGNKVKDISTSKVTAESRRLVVFTNNCSAANRKELNITKAMKEGQTTTDTFSFKISLESTEGELVPYVGSYYLKDKDGNYYENKNGKLTKLTESDIAGTTDSEGRVTGIPAGYTVSITQILSGTQFKVEEVELSSNYKVPTITVSDCDDADTSQSCIATGTIKLGSDAQVTVTNSKNYKILKVQKSWKDSDESDLDSDLLPENTFVGLYKKNNLSGQPEQIKEINESDNNWTCQFEIEDNPNLSDYTVREVTGETGNYKVVGESEFIKLGDYIYQPKYTESISQDSEGQDIKQVSIVNTLQRGSIEITKCNANKDKLGGAEFEITGPGNYKTIVTTPLEGSQKGIVKISDLLPGEYTITETKAPNNYSLLTNSIKVVVGTTEGESTSSGIKVVGDDDTTYYYDLKMEIINNKLFDMPEAGGGFRATLIGIAVMFIAGGWYIIRKRRRIV